MSHDGEILNASVAGETGVELPRVPYAHRRPGGETVEIQVRTLGFTEGLRLMQMRDVAAEGNNASGYEYLKAAAQAIDVSDDELRMLGVAGVSDVMEFLFFYRAPTPTDNESPSSVGAINSATQASPISPSTISPSSAGGRAHGQPSPSG